MKVMSKVNVTDKINKSGAFIIRYILCSFFTFIMAFLLLKFPMYSMEGVKKGIKICMESLIPSLYPFMILTNYYTASPFSDFKITLLEKLCSFLFKLPGRAAAAIAFSFIGGLPIGASMSADLYRKGIISKEQCSRMLCFCVNPGPAFVISTVGLTMLGSAKTGVLIYASLIISSLITGVSTRFFASDGEDYISFVEEKENSAKGIAIEKAVVKIKFN